MENQVSETILSGHKHGDYPISKVKKVDFLSEQYKISGNSEEKQNI